MVQKKQSNKAETHQEENYSIIAGVLAGLIIVLGGGLLWSNQQRIVDLLDESQDSVITEQLEESESNALYIGKDLAVSGIIISDANYTYVSTNEYGIIGLENIEDFSEMKNGSALIGGTITSFMNNTYFLTINTYSSDKVLSSEIEEIVVDQSPQDKIFVAPAGILFSSLLTNAVTVQPNVNQQYITISQNEGKNKITINYFLCKKGHKNYDCAAELATLNKTKNLEKAFTTSEGDIIYRIKNTNQRYGSIDGRFGYYISSNSQAFMNQVFKTMTFVSNKYVKTKIVPELANICSDSSSNLMMSRVTSSNLLFFDDLLSIDVSGKDAANKNMQCIVLIDLSTPLGGSIISLDYTNVADRPAVNDEATAIIEIDDTNDDTIVDEPTTASNIQNNASVTQFPVKLEDPLVYTFGAGYTISFPSKNISFGSQNHSTNLDMAGVTCSIRTDIIDYPNADLKHESPAISIYVCSTKLTASQVGSYGYIPSSTAGKVYLIQVNNPAWTNFAKNMTITD